jgi:hypothetical protein
VAEGNISLRTKEEEILQCKFNTQNIGEFVTTSKRKVRFWENKEMGVQGNTKQQSKNISEKGGVESLVSYEPTMIKKDELSKDKDNNRLFVQSEFLPEERSWQAVSATVDGQLIMWDKSLILEESNNIRNRREVKSINLLSSFNKVCAFLFIIV